MCAEMCIDICAGMLVRQHVYRQKKNVDTTHCKLTANIAHVKGQVRLDCVQASGQRLKAKRSTAAGEPRIDMATDMRVYVCIDMCIDMFIDHA